MNISKLELLTNSVQQTEAFYNEVLKLPVLDKTENSISFSAGKSVLTFKQDNEVDKPIYHVAFNIPHNQLEEAIEWARNNIELLSVTEDRLVADFEAWNANSIYFYDNNKNLMEFIVRHELKNDSDVPFSAQSVDCISEIGLVTNDVVKLADELMVDYKVPVFFKQPRTDKFVVLGDDYGLLILVENGRNWFPTEVAAVSYPLKITVSNESSIAEQVIQVF